MRGGSGGLLLRGSKQADNRQAFTNCAFTDPETFQNLYNDASEIARVGKTAVRCVVNNFVVNVLADRGQASGCIAASLAMRTCARIPLDKDVMVTPWSSSRPLESFVAGTITVSLAAVGSTTNTLTVTDNELETWCREKLQGQILTLNQSIFLEAIDAVSGAVHTMYGSINKIEGLTFGTETRSNDADSTSNLQGLVQGDTEFDFQPQSVNIKVRRTRAPQRNLFKTDFNFEQLGIGGLDKEFADIFRRAFASRIYPPHVVQQLGICHVRGMLLYGPPGTGKTLIARQIGKALRAKEPKIVNGPEVLNKFVGQSEENIRNLFADAEADQKKLGENSPLHIIIFDELDAICKARGSVPSGAGVNDSVVNQLLSKIDGVDALNNILLIGMTNRLDMLDEALLRPGRLEVHIEIGLPDEAGRLQILRIHTAPMREADRLDQGVSLETLAKRTKNFSGAEIAGLIRSAVSYAFARNVDLNNITAPTDLDVKVTADDFEEALKEVKPAFGVAEDALSQYILNDIIPFSTTVDKLRSDLVVLTKQVKESASSPLVSVLLWGSPGSGKTAMAAHIAQTSGFPFVKIVSPNDYLGYHEAVKTMSLTKCFDDAYKSELSIIILDDIERLLDYTSIGPRFSNTLLQALMTLVKKVPPKEGRRLLVIGTTSEPTFIQESGLLAAFQLAYHAPVIKNAESLQRCLAHRLKTRHDFNDSQAQKLVAAVYPAGSTVKIGVKKLFLALEMASEMAKPDMPDYKIAIQCLKDFGVNF